MSAEISFWKQARYFNIHNKWASSGMVPTLYIEELAHVCIVTLAQQVFCKNLYNVCRTLQPHCQKLNVMKKRKSKLKQQKFFQQGNSVS